MGHIASYTCIKEFEFLSTGRLVLCEESKFYLFKSILGYYNAQFKVTERGYSKIDDKSYAISSMNYIQEMYLHQSLAGKYESPVMPCLHPTFVLFSFTRHMASLLIETFLPRIFHLDFIFSRLNPNTSLDSGLKCVWQEYPF